MILIYALSDSTTTTYLFHFEIESHADFGLLVFKNHRLYHKTHVDCIFFEHTGWSVIS
jgi:hypothetical protein